MIKPRRLVLACLLIAGIGFIVLVVALLLYATQFAPTRGLPLPILADKVLLEIDQQFPETGKLLRNKLGITRDNNADLLEPLSDFEPEQFSHADLAQQSIRYDQSGTPQSITTNRPLTDLRLADRAGRLISVATTEQLKRAVKFAKAGDIIVVETGQYLISGSAIEITTAGQANAPIVVRAHDRRRTAIKFDAVNGFHVQAPFWRFENLLIEGVCASHNKCEHAFHVIGDAHSVVIRNNVIKNFNAAIKVNGVGFVGGKRFPDNGLIQNNSIFNTSIRRTANPVTPIDIVGANAWVVRGNLIADFAKSGGDKISYAAFMKGNSTRGLFERNLVICEMRLTGHGTRIGLSFGGGGTGRAFCRDNQCTNEHSHGVIRSNIIMRCPREVGVYLNRAVAIEISNNTFHQTLGIDVNYTPSNATIFNNVIHGRVHSRYGGDFERRNNLISTLGGWFWQSTPNDWFNDADKGNFDLRSSEHLANQGIDIGPDIVDFCGRKRPSTAVDLGAIEYSSQTNNGDGSRCAPMSLFGPSSDQPTN